MENKSYIHAPMLPCNSQCHVQGSPGSGWRAAPSLYVTPELSGCHENGEGRNPEVFGLHFITPASVWEASMIFSCGSYPWLLKSLALTIPEPWILCKDSVCPFFSVFLKNSATQANWTAKYSFHMTMGSFQRPEIDTLRAFTVDVKEESWFLLCKYLCPSLISSLAIQYLRQDTANTFCETEASRGIELYV